MNIPTSYFRLLRKVEEVDNVTQIKAVINCAFQPALTPRIVRIVAQKQVYRIHKFLQLPASCLSSRSINLESYIWRVVLIERVKHSGAHLTSPEKYVTAFCSAPFQALPITSATSCRDNLAGHVIESSHAIGHDSSNNFWTNARGILIPLWPLLGTCWLFLMNRVSALHRRRNCHFWFFLALHDLYFNFHYFYISHPRLRFHDCDHSHNGIRQCLKHYRKLRTLRGVHNQPLSLRGFYKQHNVFQYAAKMLHVWIILILQCSVEGSLSPP